MSGNRNRKIPSTEEVLFVSKVNITNPALFLTLQTPNIGADGICATTIPHNDYTYIQTAQFIQSIYGNPKNKKIHMSIT